MSITCQGHTVYIENASAAMSVKEAIENRNGSTPIAGFRLQSLAWDGQTAGHTLNMTIGSASAAISAVKIVSPANNTHLTHYFDDVPFDDLNIASGGLSSGTVILTLRD